MSRSPTWAWSTSISSRSCGTSRLPTTEVASGATPLVEGDREGTWSVWITGNYRLTFEIEGEDATNVDLEDYHQGIRSSHGNVQPAASRRNLA
ncbi:MAG: type II toxin-antitoxin system RelE/ParE family toxin [Roseiarcus sp.]